jgi:hypothetical protein
LGDTVVTFSYTDTSGNTGTGSATVTVSDTIAPVVTAPGDIAVEAPGTAAITTFFTGSTSTDAVEPAPIVTNNAPSSFPSGATVVTFTHTDASGNSGSATATVTVSDTIAPVVTAPANTIVEAPSGAALTAFLAGSTVVDAGDPVPVFSHNAPAPLPLGATLVTFNYTDAAGNVGTDAATVTGVDTGNPVVTAPGNITVEAASAAGTEASNGSIAAFFAASSSTDAVDSSPIVTNDAPTTFPLGATIVTFTHTDASGNAGTDTATVTISDTTPPNVTAPVNITVEAASAAGTPASNSTIAAFLPGSSSSDAVDPAPGFSHNAPTTFPLGVTVVTFTYTDGAGNVGSNTATVTISDTIAPAVTAPGNITVEAASASGTAASNGSIVAFLAASASTDAVNSSPTVTTDEPRTFPLGATVVTFTHTDASGNAGTDTATVTISDTTPPVITLIGADPLTVDLYSTFTDPGTTVTDAVSTGLTATGTGAVDTSTVGSYIRSYNVTDGAGNAATTVTRTVNVEVKAPTNVSMTVSSKHLNFTWDANTALDLSRISINPDGASGFTVDPSAANIPANVTGFSLEIPVHLTDWVNAQYLVEACNTGETQCKSSPNQTVALVDSIAATFYVKASNPGPHNFGYSVALSDDGSTLAVGNVFEGSASTGINGDQTDTGQRGGAVYVYVKSGLTWVQQAYVKAPVASDFGDSFGWSVSLSSDGNTLAVGVKGENSSATGIGGDQTDNSASSPGAVHVLTRSGTTWAYQAYIKASVITSAFGWSVDLSSDGNTLAVGAFQDAGGGGGAGAVFVFTRSGTTWVQEEYITASNSGAGDNFGWSVSLSSDGNTLATGAPSEQSSATGINGDQADNSVAGQKSGAAYVFTRSGITWTQQAYIKASNTDADDNFGESLAISGDGNTLAVSAVREQSIATGIDGNQSDNSADRSGAAYIYTLSAGTWTQQAYIKASNTNVDDRFGRSIALNSDGNTLAVGAKHEDSIAKGINGDQAADTTSNSGAVYIFIRNGTTWIQKAYVKPASTLGSETFGDSVSFSDDGNTLAVGAIGEQGNSPGVNGDQTSRGIGNAGAVYLY